MGEVFAGRYELVDPIGRGGVGAVWRAWDHRRRRYVAAKVLQQSDAHSLLRFVREQALRIDHPHVLAPASWAADDDKVLFTMDLVSGGSLAHVIGDYGPLPPRFVCTLLDQLLSGLAAVHAEGVVHRDIKPANILLEATGTGRPHLRLSDFGISMRKGEPRLTETNYVVGTPGYFAPEQMLGAEPDFPADLFALGLVALYLLQGQKPDSRALVEHFAAHGTPGAPQGIPEPLWQVLAGLLQPDPHARFRTATGARKALTSAVELLPEPAVDDEPVEIFDQLGPLPSDFGPDGPAGRGSGGPRTDAAPSGEPTGGHTSRTGRTDRTGQAQQAGRRDGADSRSRPPQPQPDPEPQPQQTGQALQGELGSHGSQGAALPSPSETGSFHLPPPPQRLAPSRAGDLPSASAPQGTPGPPVPTHAGQPHGHQPPAPDFAQAPTAAVPHEQPLTRQYTGHGPQVPGQAHPVPYAPLHAPAHAPSSVPLPTARKRPGPPQRVVVPVLLVALVCFAVGIWALAQA
ncbi:serine/threonine-protein kinase [Streptomyces marianii]|uniref:non-specific serine/threonine protein kinase n=1 Tax=Streptomyces marianii TaxID=1817406 RepID=A0A5R9E4E5_9ACTN|nr:serine/threonine-protein kinase [Streptomyces marianii]TLQ44840.1 serine/threonine protein kinase [Streptomyces marianii]